MDELLLNILTNNTFFLLFAWLIGLGIFVLAGSLVGLYIQEAQRQGAQWAHFGVIAGLLGTVGLMVAMGGLEGRGLIVVADFWAEGHSVEENVAVARAVSSIAEGIIAMSFVVYWTGLLFFGMAFLTSKSFPTWLSWVGVTVGLLGILAGLLLSLTGASDLLNVLVPGVTVVTMVWFIVLGVLLWQKSATQT